MHKLLARQFRRAFGIDETRAADVLAELRALAVRGDMSPEAASLLTGLDDFFARAEASYTQSERDLELKTRSLELSSSELSLANERLRQELVSRTRAIESLRETANSLMQGSDSQLSPLADDNLEALSQLMADLVHQGETSQRALQNALIDLANQKYALDQHAIVSMTDLQGNITYANDKFCEISGYSREELIGRNHRIVKSNVHPPVLFREMWDTIAAGRVWHGEICNRRRDGQHYWVNATIVPLPDKNGLPCQYIGIRTDITARKHMETQIAESEQRYRSVVENLKEVIFRTDAFGRWTYLNPAWTEVTGFSVDESLGQSSLDIIPHDERQQAAETFHAMAKRELGEIRQEQRHLTRSGDMRWIEVFARAEFDAQGHFTGTSGTLNDVTERRRALAQLHEQLHFVQELLEAVPIPIYLKDTAGRYLHFNKAFEEFFGVQRADWLGKTVFDLFAPELAAFHAEKDKEVFQTLGRQIYEARVFTRQGVARDTIYRKATLTRPDGSISGLVGTIADITERKSQEAEIKAGEARLRHITNTVPGAVFQWEVSGEKIRYTFLSDRVGEIRGLDRDALFADATLATAQILDEDRERIRQGVFTAARLREHWQDEYRITLPNGTLRWIRGEINPALEPAANGATVFTGIWQDVTALKEADARLREVTDNIPVAVYQYERQLDGIHAFRFFSQGLERICGLPAEEAVANAQGLFALIHPDDMGSMSASIAASAEQLSPWSLEFRLVHRQSGETIWIHGESRPKRLPSGSTLWNGYIADVTPARQASEELRRAKEAAEAANRAKSDFLANMSHEIRTPMNGVIGMTDLALDTELTEEQREYLQIVKSSSESLLTIINDILDFSKIEAGKMLIEHISFNLWRAVSDTLKTLAARAHAKGLELIFDIDPETPTFVVGDPGRLRQILINLTGNAIKFTEHGEIVVHVEPLGSWNTTPDAAPGGCELRFSVRDSGIGIPADKIETIFDAFSQEDSSITRKYGGTGLGLTISSRLVDMLGGKLQVESEPGKGSVFQFTARFGHDTQQHERLAAAPRLHGKRVLIVDDNPVNRLVLSGTLKSVGATVREAASGIEALEILSGALEKTGAAPCDIVLLDACMPELDGFTTAERLLALPGCKELPLVMLSSGGVKGDAQRCRDIGFAAYLPKPIARDELLQALGRTLRAQHGESPALVTRHLLRDEAVDQGSRLPPLDVLLVEDHPINQKLAINLLERWGHRVTLAENGLQAIEATAAQRFDIVLMDMMMPIMGGEEATRRIRQAEHASGRLRQLIVAMTAKAMQGDRESCLAAGADDYLSKPIKSTELQQMLARHCSHRSDSVQQADEASAAINVSEHVGHFDYAQALCQADQETVAIVAEMFLEQYAQDLEAIRQALLQDDFYEAQRQAHTLKGTLAMFGARPARDIAGTIEQQMARQESAVAPEMLHRLDVEMERVAEALRAFVEKLR